MNQPSGLNSSWFSMTAAAALLVTLTGCGTCGDGCSDSTVAVVTEVESHVERDHVSSVEAWQPAEVRDAIRMGEAVRTGANGRAELELTAGGGLRLGPDSMVRFGGRPNETPTLQWERGTIDVDTDEAFLITTEFGPLRIRRGTRFTATYGDDGVEVVFGSAEIANGARLGTGDTFDGRTGAPRAAEAPSAEAGVSAVPELPTTDQDVLGDADGGGTVGLETGSGPRAPGIARYEFSVAAGSGGVIHHPAPPAVVGVNTGCSDGEVRVESNGSATTYTGGGTVGIRLGRGEARYEVSCAGQPTSNGRFVVTNDAGRRRLNTRSQRHTVMADGRRYTFLYEGALPTLLLRWNAAPDAEQYTVNLVGTRGLSLLTSATPTVRVPNSALRDGEVTFQFAAGGRESARTTITLRYDTATPTAMVDAPADRAFAGGATIPVSGTAQVGSQVAVGGQRLEVDRRGAFSGTANSENGGLAVRITTPSQGTHYFVRRSASAMSGL